LSCSSQEEGASCSARSTSSSPSRAARADRRPLALLAGTTLALLGLALAFVVREPLPTPGSPLIPFCFAGHPIVEHVERLTARWLHEKRNGSIDFGILR